MICNVILIHNVVSDTELISSSNHDYNFQGDNDNIYKVIRLKYTINLKIMFKMTTYH